MTAQRVVNVADLAPEQAEFIAALIAADRSSRGEAFDEHRFLRDAERARSEAERGRRRAAAQALIAMTPGNPYVAAHWGEAEERSGVWRGRYRYMTRPRWSEREMRAHDLRNDSTGTVRRVPVAMKRRYQWAVEAWMQGNLDARTFWREVKWFDEAVSVALVDQSRTDGAIADRMYVGEDWIKHETRRLERLLKTEGYVDRERWGLIHQRIREAQERNDRWLIESLQRMETARQRALLRQGHRTLTDIRRLLRGPVSSRPPESKPARTSPT